jgi:putative endonuclease
MREWREKRPCVYIMASKRNGVLYTGVTSNLWNRFSIHKQDLIGGFTKKYGVHLLVYYEFHETMDAAIRRETRIKKWKRAWKVRLIHSMNPEWLDLCDDQSGAVLDGPSDTERQRE